MVALLGAVGGCARGGDGAADGGGPDVDWLTQPGVKDGGGEAAQEGCACKKAGADITTSLACYCSAAGCPTSSYSDQVAEWTLAPRNGECFQVRTYGACGLKAVAYQNDDARTYTLQVYDAATGVLVGVRLADDSRRTCPFDGKLRGTYLLAGLVPPSDCVQSGCMEICEGMQGTCPRNSN